MERVLFSTAKPLKAAWKNSDGLFLLNWVENKWRKKSNIEDWNRATGCEYIKIQLSEFNS